MPKNKYKFAKISTDSLLSVSAVCVCAVCVRNVCELCALSVLWYLKWADTKCRYFSPPALSNCYTLYHLLSLCLSQVDLIFNEEGSCPLCNKTFSRKSSLMTHIRNHSAERKFVCSYCHKGGLSIILTGGQKGQQSTVRMRDRHIIMEY